MNRGKYISYLKSNNIIYIMYEYYLEKGGKFIPYNDFQQFFQIFAIRNMINFSFNNPVIEYYNKKFNITVLTYKNKIIKTY